MMDILAKLPSLICTPESLSSGDSLTTIKAWLTSLRQDSPANPSATPESAKVAPMTETDGLTPFALLEPFSPGMSFSKTCADCYRPTPLTAHAATWYSLIVNGDVTIAPIAGKQWNRPQRTLFGTANKYSQTWQKAGTQHLGVCYLRPKWERRISEIGSGLLRVTPTAQVMGSNTALRKDGLTLSQHIEQWQWPTPRTQDGEKMGKASLGDAWSDESPHNTTYPTPRANDAEKRGHIANDPRNGLSAAVMYPTPTTSDHTGAQRARNKQGGDSLRTAVTYPTPQASDDRPRGNWHDPVIQRRLEKGKQVQLSTFVTQFPSPVASGKLNGGSGNYQQIQQLADAGHISEEERRSMTAGNGGQLNPAWVEWLMGWPIGWTSLEPLPQQVMDGYLERVSSGTYWHHDPAEVTFEEMGTAVPRLAGKTAHRTERLKACGNGQVPQTATATWFILNNS